MAQTGEPAQKKPVMPPDSVQHMNVMGLEFDFDPAQLDDLEVMEWMYNASHGRDNPAGALDFIPLLQRLTGRSIKDIKQAIKDPETGRADSARIQRFLEELFTAVSPNS